MERAPLPPSMTKDLRLAFIKPNAAVLASPRVFTPHGKSGIEFSDYLPHMGRLRRRHVPGALDVHGAFNHHPGQLMLFGGSIQVGRPTWASWVLYGLGSESRNLPGFVVLGFGVGTSGGRQQLVERFLPVDVSAACAFRKRRRPGAVPFELRPAIYAGDAARRVWTCCRI